MSEIVVRIGSEVLAALPRDLAFVALAFVALLFARLFKDWTTPFKLDGELTTRDNPALGISVAGYYGAVLILFLGPLSTPMQSAEPVPLWRELLVTGGYLLLGVVLLNVARFVVDRALLVGFSTAKEIVRDRNVGTGAVEAGAYLASGLNIAGALHGQGGGPHTALAFFALGQLALVGYGHLYRLLCRYDIHAEIERDNVAAGAALGLNLVAFGVVLFKAVAGDFVDWPQNLTRFAVVTLLGGVLLLALRYLVDLIVVPGAHIRREIVEDRNLNVAWIEGAVLTGVAGLLVTVL